MEEFGLSNTIETGKFVPSVITAFTIAQVFQVPVEALFRLAGTVGGSERSQQH